jgi:hypothetical protein
MLLVWPDDRTRWDLDTQDIEFDNPDGTAESIVDGDRVTLGGGGGSTSEDGAWVDQLPWIAAPVASCPLDAYWVVGSVER